MFSDFNSWIYKIMLGSLPSFAYLECHCSLFISEECVEKLVHDRVLLYSTCSYFCTRTLAIGSCKSEKRGSH